MISKRASLIVILILSGLTVLALPVRALPETQTIHIDGTGDDGYVLESGAGISTSYLVAVLDPSQDIRAWLVFRQIEINGFETLQNATLRLRTSSSLPFEASSSITIYGVRDGEFPGFASASQVLSAPLTSAHVDYNSSQFSGSTWKEIDVSSIVEEMKSQPSYEGDGVDGLGIPGTFGFIIFGAEGHDARWFYDLSNGNGYEAQLVIHWGEAPDEPDPADKPPSTNGSDQVWVYVNTTPAYIPPTNETEEWTGEVDIFKVLTMGPPEMILDTANNLKYYNTSWGNGSTRAWASAMHVQSGSSSEQLATRNGVTFMIGGNTSNLDTNLYWSRDEFQTYNRSARLNNYYPGVLSLWDSGFGCIWASQNDTDAFNFSIAWVSKTFADFGFYQIVFTTFVYDPLTNNITLGALEMVCTGMNGDQDNPDMYLQRDGTTHIVWDGINGTAEQVISYRRRQANGTWLNVTRPQSFVGWGSIDPDVVANEVTGVALVVWYQYDVHPIPWDMRWDVVFPNNTLGTPVGAGVDRGQANRDYISVVNDRSNNTAHMSYADHDNKRIYYTYKSIDNTSAWSADIRLDVGADRSSYNVIGFDEENRTLCVVWWDMDDSDNEWLYWVLDTTPVAAENQLLDIGVLQYIHSEDYFNLEIVNVTWWAVWPNGTVITGNATSLDDLLVALDEVLGINPLDPNPPSKGWDTEGPFTRFNTRFYIWLIGVVGVWGPIMFFAYRRPTGYIFVVGCLIILSGFAFLIAAGAV